MNQLVKFHGGKRIGSRAPVGIEEARLVGHVDGIGRRPVAGAAAADDHLGTGGGDISLGGGDQWPELVRVLDDGRLEVDNNRCENALRPFVLGRRAWLFSDTPAGAEASARLYGLIETAKANGCEPYAYLRRVFTDMPKATTLAQIEALLPWNIARPATQSVAA